MTTLLVSDAVTLVRKAIDELDPNGSIMYDDNAGSANTFNDNNSLNDTIQRCLPEAINAIHLAAPAHLLEGDQYRYIDPDEPQGEDPEPGEYGDVSLSIDAEADGTGILNIYIGDWAHFMRLVAFKAADSSVVVTDVVPEASAEGRKQLNKYIRGRSDRPRMVRQQRVFGAGSYPARVHLKYYTLDDATLYASDPSSAIEEFAYIREQLFSSLATGYDISEPLRQNIIDLTTAMVLEIYGEQRSEVFVEKAKNFQKI